jgi:hypothetical protein
MKNRPQHDDHIWLCVNGEMWAIRFMRWPIIYFWRGYSPNLEFCAVEMSEFRPDEYYVKIIDMWRTEGYIQ